MKRRDFLKESAVLTASAAAGLQMSQGASAFGQTASRAAGPGSANPVLVLIYLRGGQDQLSTIVPYNDRTYYGIRPTVAVPAEAVVKLDQQWGLHPALKPLKRFYDQKRVAVVLNCGSPHPTRSHFDAQDFMEYAAPGNRTVRDGWLNRYLQATAAGEKPQSDVIRAVAMQELLPRSMRGEYPVVAVPPNLNETEEVLDLFEEFYAGSDPEKAARAIKKATGKNVGIAADPVMASGQETVQGLRRLRELLFGDNEALYGARTTATDELTFQEYPGHWFASRMKAIAKLIKQDVGVEVVATDINGWDHHIGMGALDGTLDRMLAFLAESLAAFMDDLGPQLDRTVIVMCTEFGRVCKENGNDGTDHGHGGLMWVLGGQVQGGIHGKWGGLAPADLHEKRDLPATTDFRDVFAEVLRTHMKFNIPQNFFPNYKPSTGKSGLFA